MKPIDAGTLNRRIQIQQQSTSQDALGQPLQTWTTFYTCWANISVQNSQLIYSTAEFMDKVVHRITIRYTYSTVIQANQRIVYIEPTTNITHTYHIEAVLNTETANKELVLLAYENAASE